MAIYKNKFTVNTESKKATYINITNNVKDSVKNSGIKEGICVVTTRHTTCAIFFEEYVHDINEEGDEFLQEDLNNVLRKIIPDHRDETAYKYPGEKHYQAVENWENADDYLPNGDRSALWNADAHLKSTIIGASETLEVTGGKLRIGGTGYIYLVDFDQTRERQREVTTIIMGE